MGYVKNPSKAFKNSIYHKTTYDVTKPIKNSISSKSRKAELKESEKTIVIVTHDLGSVERLCTRAVWIFEGKVRMDDKPKKVIEEYLKVCG